MKVEDIEEIINREVIMIPALFIEGEAKVVGRVPSVEEIKKILKS